MSKTTNRTEAVIGQLMRFYRRTPLHSAKMGKFLAGILSRLVVFRKNPLVIKEIDNVRFELDLREVIDSSLYFSGTFEAGIEMLINSLVKPGMASLDIGANIGYHTFRMAGLVEKGGQVYAVEPTSWAYRKLLRNATLNPHFENITFFQVGFSDSDIGKVQTQFQSSYRLDGKHQLALETIELITLDTFITREKIRKIDFIKLDVDGFEGKVLKGAVRLLREAKPIILMEINPSEMLENGDNPDDMAWILRDAGYSFETTDGKPIDDLSAYWRDTMGRSTMILARNQTESRLLQS